MGNSARVTLEGLGDAIAQELTVYAKGVQDGVNKAGRKAVKELVRKTRDTAPFNARAYHQHYADQITSKTVKSRTGDDVHIWYAKGAAGRLTHLLAKGHETRDGGRTRPDPFLQNALDAVLPDYDKEVEEAVKNGK